MSPAESASNGMRAADAMTERTVKGEKASNPERRAGANVRTYERERPPEYVGLCLIASMPQPSW
jgi:hypothetical protein